MSQVSGLKFQVSGFATRVQCSIFSESSRSLPADSSIGVEKERGQSGASFSSRSADWLGDSPPSRLLGPSVPGDPVPQPGGRGIRVNSPFPVQRDAGRVDEAAPEPEREAGEMTVPGSVRQCRRSEIGETEEGGRFAGDRAGTVGVRGVSVGGGVAGGINGWNSFPDPVPGQPVSSWPAPGKRLW